MTDIQKINLNSKNLIDERVEQLKTLFPEIQTEGNGSIDFDKLRLILGDEINDEKERYAFTWPGKTEAIRQAQIVSNATLRPCIEKSRSRNGEDGNFDSDNIYIEGDNLEVLKLLQRAYHNKINMIYIDPPYNTGHDFIYPDSFGDSIKNYKEQVNLSEQSNAEVDGRYHSKWCSMMYPRLKLARELLSEDGVIFISIDNNEQSNLKKICDEVFGEKNFITQLAIENNPKGRKNSIYFAESYEHCLAYAKNSLYIYRMISESDQKKFFNGIDTDEDSRKLFQDEYGYFKQSKRQVVGINKSSPLAKDSNIDRCFTVYYHPKWDKLFLEDEYDVASNTWIQSEHGIELIDKGYRRYCSYNKENNQPSIPLYSKQTMHKLFENHSLYFKDDGTIYEKVRDNKKQINSFISNKKYGLDLMTESATSKMEALFGMKNVFKGSKAIDFIKMLINLYPSKDFIILDFFSGSATAAHANMLLNTEDSGNRRFIMIQLPESIEDESEMSDNPFNTICDIGEERIRKAGNKIKADLNQQNLQLQLGTEPLSLPDIGFRVFQLDESGVEHPKDGQLVLDVIKSDRTELDIVFEMMLRWGLELTLPVEKTFVAEYPIWSVACNELVCCMKNGLTISTLNAIVETEPRRVLILDSILDDTLKLNAVQIFKHASESTGYEIELRTI